MYKYISQDYLRAVSPVQAGVEDRIILVREGDEETAGSWRLEAVAGLVMAMVAGLQLGI